MKDWSEIELKKNCQKRLLKWIPLFFVIFLFIPGCLLNTSSNKPNPTPDLSPTPTASVSPNAVNFTLSDLDGVQYSLSDYRGKPVLITFFGYSCPHCRNEVPRVQNLYIKYKDSQDLVVLGIGVSSSIGELREFKAKYGLTFPILYDFNRNVYHQFFSQGIPALLLINKQGEVAYAYNRSELTQTEIDNLLKTYIF